MEKSPTKTNNSSMKMGAILGVLIVTLLVIAAYEDDDKGHDSDRNDSIRMANRFALLEQRTADSIYQAKALIEQGVSDSLNQVKKQKEFNQLVKNFIEVKDEFKDLSFYYHRNWGKNWLNRKTLTAYVNSNGYRFLKSNYHDDDWIFHSSVSVKIGDDMYTSSTVPRYEDNNVTKATGGGVYEIVTYTRENNIIEKIGLNTDKKIKVRFQGDQFHHDVSLWKTDKEAMRDVYRLGYLLKTGAKAPK